MDLNHLIDLISQLPENTSMNYVRGESTCTFVRIDKNEIRLYAKTPEGKDVTFAESFLSELAQRIEPNVAFNTSQLLNNKGSNRAVVDSIIANTAEFYWITKDRAKFTVWIPSKPHEPGILVEWTDTGVIVQTPPASATTSTFSKIILNDEENKHYTDDELAKILAEMYQEGVDDSSKTGNLLLFGIKYGGCINNAAQLCKKANIPLPTAVSDGVKLYKLIKANKYGISFWNRSMAIIPKNKAIINLKDSLYRPYLTAIKSKPFLLLAGISGTGKSRIVRELARACWEEDSEEFKAQKPKNFEMIQVKPNWHDSSELIGYVSRINGERYVVGPFLRFLVKAIQNPQTPHFLCLDEMNLAPVEQYFAEYLSVIESRKINADGVVVTDPIVDYEDTCAYKSLIDQLFTDDEERKAYLTEEHGKRLSLPANLIVIGTVNMDETTFSFSRKVLDRAMTIEMNEVDLEAGLTERYEHIGKLGYEELVATAVEGVDVYSDNQEVCDKALNYLKAVNAVLEGTPFKWLTAHAMSSCFMW